MTTATATKNTTTVAVTLAQGRIAHGMGFEMPTKRSLLVDVDDIDTAMDEITDYLATVPGPQKKAVTGLYERLMAVRDADGPFAEIEAGEPDVEVDAPVDVPAASGESDTDLVFTKITVEAETEVWARPVRLEAVGRRSASFGEFDPAVEWASELVRTGQTSEAKVVNRATGEGVIVKAA